MTTRYGLAIVAGLFGLALMPSAGAEDGAALFRQHMCGACHGAGKKGGDIKASKMDKATMVKLLKDPKSVNPNATMKPVKGTDAELNAIVDFVKQ